MKKIIFCLLLLFGFLCFSQQETFPARQDTVKLQSFLKIGVSLIDNMYVGVEVPFLKKFSLNLEYGGGVTGYSIRKDPDNYTNTKVHVYGSQFVKAEFKWNYNFQKRHLKKKDTEENSSNYLALQFKYFEGKADVGEINLFPILPYYNEGRRPDNVLLTDFHWGIQRNLGSHFTINFFMGLGVVYDIETHLAVTIPSFGLKFNYNFVRLF